MKTIFRLFLTLMVGLLSQSAMAEEWGDMELNKTYSVAAWDDSWGTFTATTDGTLTITSTTHNSVYLSSSKDGGKRIIGTTISVNPRIVSYAVKAGVPVYVFTEVLNTNAFDFTLTMEEGLAIKILDIEPAEGSSFVVSGVGQLSFRFNVPVNVSEATLSCKDQTESLRILSNNNYIYFELGHILFDWMDAGLVQPGDEFEVTLDGICLQEDETFFYGTDGSLTAKLKIGKKPIALKETVNLDQPFLSYYTAEDPHGKLQFAFSGNINTTEKYQPIAQIRFGDVNNSEDGGYYVENIPYSIDKNSLTVDLSGKRRALRDMLTLGTYDVIDFGLMGVRDEDGNYAYSPAQGSLGSFWYRLDYVSLKGDVSSEFDPISGSKLNNRKTIEIWFTGNDMLEYDGVSFKSPEEEIVVPLADIKSEEVDGGLALTVPVPERMKSQYNIVVTLHNLETKDGYDYSSYLTAIYNTDGTNGISSLEKGKQNAVSYSLSGQRATDGAKGVVILNGNKIIK